MTSVNAEKIIIGMGAFKWKRLMKKGASILKSWVQDSKEKKSLISETKLKAIRDELLKILKGNIL